MPKYLIERDIPGIGKLTPVEIQAISKKSNAVVGEVGRKLQWIESFVTADKTSGEELNPAHLQEQ